MNLWRQGSGLEAFNVAKIKVMTDVAKEPNERAGTTRARRLFTGVVFVYGVACLGALIYLATVFELVPVFILSLISLLPFIAAVRQLRRWNSIKTSEVWLLAIVMAFAIGGTVTVVQNWYQAGYHLPPSQEEQNWNRFATELRQDPAFRLIEHRRVRGVDWLEGSLETEADLDRLIDLARKCGIEREHLDGPYRHSISITIPETKRAHEYQ